MSLVNIRAVELASTARPWPNILDGNGHDVADEEALCNGQPCCWIIGQVLDQLQIDLVNPN